MCLHKLPGQELIMFYAGLRQNLAKATATQAWPVLFFVLLLAH